MGENTTALNDKSFDEFTKKGVAVVDFWAAWCGPCKMMGPIFDEVAGAMKGKVTFGKVDVDANGEIAQRFGIMSIPTIVIFKDGERVDQITGVVAKDELSKKIEAAQVTKK